MLVVKVTEYLRGCIVGRAASVLFKELHRTRKYYY